MNELIFIAGLVLLFWGLLEGLWTTIWVDGNSAPLTSRLTTGIWKFFRLVVPKGNHRILSLAGPTILAMTVVSWVVFIWMGWTIIFYSDPSSILVKATNSSPDFSDCWWYVAYTMFTVGNGDFTPQGDWWQIASSLVAFTGMSMVTLSITYLLQVISAVANKRAFASEVTGIGKTAEEFVIKQWTGKDFGAIELQLNSLSSKLTMQNEQHMAFPILHYYHAAREEKSQDVAVAILDDALSLIKFGMEEKNLPPETILTAARSSVDTFLITVEQAFIKPAKNIPQNPQISRVKEAGVPVIPEQEFLNKLKKEEDRRKLILGLINNGAWRWPGEN